MRTPLTELNLSIILKLELENANASLASHLSLTSTKLRLRDSGMNIHTCIVLKHLLLMKDEVIENDDCVVISSKEKT